LRVKQLSLLRGQGEGADIFLIAKQPHLAWALYSKAWVIAIPFSYQRAHPSVTSPLHAGTYSTRNVRLTWLMCITRLVYHRLPHVLITRATLSA
jgi:hypothetical protein